MKKGVNVGNSHTYDMDKLYARLLMVSEHRYIHLSDLWESTTGKLCSVHSMYKVDSQAVQWYTW